MDSTASRGGVWGHYYGHETVVKVLLASGAEKEVENNDGWTVLHAAAKNGQETVVKFLLDNGVENEAKTKMEWVALHIAA
jgi:ankyrin repeat protein